jgi:DUF4097 and DUF4098 domain-containing protein YvlB
MNSNYTRFFCFALLLALFILPEPATSAQEVAKARAQSKSYDFCSNHNNYNGDKVGFNEVRELTLPAASLLTVDGERNGGIKITGENRTDVFVRACVRTWGTSDEAARAIAKNIRIETGSVLRAENSNEENWSVSYQISVPRSTNLKLTTHNGGIGISGVEGNMEFDALNGGVHLANVGGNVRGKTTNGGLHVALSGNSWKGAGLDVETTNGGVHLFIPETYAARIETGTVNGGFKSDIPALNVERKERSRAMRLNADFNGGGAPVRLITTNGGVKISSSRADSQVP